MGTLGELFKEWQHLALELEVAIAAALRCGRRQETVELLDILGRLASKAHDFHRAALYHQRALQVAREACDRRGESDALIELGYVYQELGDMQSKLQVYREWLLITRETRDQRNECLALCGLGDASSTLGEEQQAIACYQQALSLARTLGQHREAEFILNSLGRVYQQGRRVGEAIDYYQQSMVTFRDIGDIAGEDWTRWHLALAYEVVGDDARAATLVRECVTFAMVRDLASAPERTAHLIQLQQREHPAQKLFMRVHEERSNGNGCNTSSGAPRLPDDAIP